MATDPPIQSILARLMAMPPDQIDAMLPAQQVPLTSPGTSVTGPVGAPHLQLLPPTPATTANPQLVSPPGRVSFAATGVTGGPATAGSALVPTPPTTPSNPHIAGSLKNLAFALPEVTPAELLPYYEFHGGSFSAAAGKEKFANLENVQTCQAFAVVRSADSWVKIVHSLGKYMAPFGKELVDVNHDGYFVFKGGMTARCAPPIIKLDPLMLQEFKARV